MVTVSAEIIKPSLNFAEPLSEGDESITQVKLPLELNHELAEDITINYEPEILSAEEYLDFELPQNLFVNIKAGETTGYLEFTVLDDKISENNERLAFNLSAPDENECFVLNKPVRHIYTILDNDDADIIIDETDDQTVVSEDKPSDNFTIALTTEPMNTVKISIEWDNNSLKINNSYFNIKSHNWNIPTTITVSCENDICIGDSDVQVTISSTSSDFDYNNIYKTLTVHILGAEPVPPTVTCIEISNNQQPTWNWTSGGGVEEYKCTLNDSYPRTGDANYYTPESPLSDKFNTLCVQEKDHTGSWSDCGLCTIEIDTGRPCSQVHSPSAVDAQNSTFTITYDYNDIYKDETCGSTNSGSGVTKVELWVAGPDEDEFSLAATDSNDNIDSEFEFTATNEGTYRFYTRAIDKANNEELIQTDSSKIAETIYAENFSGYAIILVGSIYGEEGLESHTLTANNIYKRLIHRGFWPEHIKYFNPFGEKQQGETDYTDHGESYPDAIEDVITNWAPEQLNLLPGPIYIILIDHGSTDTFHLSGTQSLNSGTFNTYLSSLDQFNEESNTIVILGTCYSGSFIDDISAPGRIIVTSSAEDEISYKAKDTSNGIRDGEFFTTNLFNELTKGKNLQDSFNTAVLRTEIFTYTSKHANKAPFNDTALQHPLLDDNGDSSGNNSLPLNGDGFKAANIILGHENEAGNFVKFLKTTESPKIIKFNEDTFTLTANLSDIKNNYRVWGEIRKPDVNIEQSDNNTQQQIELEEFEMELDENSDTFKFEYNFEDPGKYLIFFYVTNNEGIDSDYKEIVVYKNKENNSPPEFFNLIYPSNDLEDLQPTDVIIEWEQPRDPENDKITYSVHLSTDSEKYNANNIFDTTCFMSLPTSWDLKEVSWNVTAIDEFGNSTKTDTWKFKTDNEANNENSIVYFQIFDIDTKLPIPNATITSNNLDLTINKNVNEKGLCIKRFSQSGTLNLAISANNYKSINNTIQIDSDKIHAFNFYLDFKSSLGDQNRNSIIDIGDAIQYLQILSGMDESEHFIDKDALFDESVGLKDVIYVLQEVSDHL